MSKISFSMPSPQEINHLIEFCKVMATSQFYAKLGPGGVLAIYLTAKERNLPFMACLNGGVYTFDGKITYSAIMINAMIINAGHTADLLELTDERCVIRFTRGDRINDPSYKPLDYVYDIKMAERADYLKKQNWKTSPRDMLYSRCLTGGGRKHIPEVFVGVLVAGELVGDDSDQYIQPMVPPQVLDQSTPLQIEHVKAPGYDDFCKKHELDTTGTMKHEFVSMTVKKSGKNEIEIINAAMQNEEIFEERFEKWLSMRKK